MGTRQRQDFLARRQIIKHIEASGFERSWKKIWNLRSGKCLVAFDTSERFLIGVAAKMPGKMINPAICLLAYICTKLQLCMTVGADRRRRSSLQTKGPTARCLTAESDMRHAGLCRLFALSWSAASSRCRNAVYLVVDTAQVDGIRDEVDGGRSRWVENGTKWRMPRCSDIAVEVTFSRNRRQPRVSCFNSSIFLPLRDTIHMKRSTCCSTALLLFPSISGY